MSCRRRPALLGRHSWPAAQLGAQAYIRQGVTIESTPFNGTDWTNNVTRFRAEERLALATPRPSALCKVTGL